MDIVEELRKDRESGARRLEAEYKAGLMTLARRFCIDEGDAEELVNRTFAAVIEGIDDYLEQSAFFGWMCQILTNIHAKDNRRKSVDDVIYTGVAPELPDESGAERIYREVDASFVRDAIESLPGPMRETLLLHYYAGIPVAKIARILSIPSGTVLSRLHYARKALAAKLGVKAKDFARKPGGKAVLLALLFCGLTALGAGVAALRGALRTPHPAEDTRQSTIDIRQSEACDLRLSTFDFQPTATSNLPQSPSGVAGSPQRGAEGGAAFSQGEKMNTTKTARAAMLASATLAATATAGTYTWLASPASATWDASALNWSDGITSGVAWVDGNDAVFPASSSQMTVSIPSGETRSVGNLTTSAAYTFANSGTLSVSGTITMGSAAATATTFDGPLTSDRDDGSLHFAAPSGDWKRADLNNANNSQSSTVLEGTVFVAPKSDGALGALPATPADNILVASGAAPTLFAPNALAIGANRTVKLAAGTTFATGSNHSFTYKGAIVAEPDSTSDYARDTCLKIRSWGGLVTLDPGDGRTNGVGRLWVDNAQFKIASGATMLTKNVSATETNATLFVSHGTSATSFGATKGIMTIDAAELLGPGAGYAQIDYFGQLVITNGAKVGMAGTQCLVGLNSKPGRLIVADGGEFTVGTLRVSQSGTTYTSEIHLDEGGVIKASRLRMDNTSKGVFAFNGGTFQSTRTTDADGRNLFSDDDNPAKWANVHFTVGEKGAAFDTSNGINIWWTRPLESGVSGAADGGIRKFGTGVLVLATNNTYTGATVIESGDVQPRVANALPIGGTVCLCGATAQLDAQRTEQTIGRVEGSGVLQNVTASSITGAVAPSADGTLTFATLCSLSGDYEIRGDASGCGLLVLRGTGQDISGLKLKLVNPANFDKTKKDGYKILAAPNGYDRRFDESALPSGWQVEYMANAAYLKFPQPFVITVR